MCCGYAKHQPVTHVLSVALPATEWNLQTASKRFFDSSWIVSDDVPDETETEIDESSRALIDHPVEEIDQFLLTFDLDDEWIGIVGGPTHRDGTPAVTYNVRTIDGPYVGQLSADLQYRFEPAAGRETSVVEIYTAQVAAIERAFPAADVQCYEWPDADIGFDRDPDRY